MGNDFHSDNLSELIMQIYESFTVPGVREMSGLSITISGFAIDGTVSENDRIRKTIDDALDQYNLQPISTVANTIFHIN